MTVSLYSYVDIFDRLLATLDHVLTKGAAHAAASGASDAEMLGWRLAEDMNPLSFQVATVCLFARQWSARAAGLDAEVSAPSVTSLAEAKAAIADARSFLAALTPAQFEGRDDQPLTVTLGNGLAPTLPVGQWITGFAAANLHFHTNMAYAILRARGAALGKRDLFPAGL